MILFLHLKKINEPYETAFQDKLKAFLKKGWYVLGNEVKEFATNFANYFRTLYCIDVVYDAVVLIFKGYIQLGELQKGDAVIVPENAYITSILAILQSDLISVLAEPKLETYNINPDLIPEKITSKTKPILAVHLYRQLAEMDQINAIACKNNLLVTEDATQVHGAILEVESRKSKVESLDSQNIIPRTQAYSFYPSKNSGCLGDGGAVTTNDAELVKTIRSIRNYGSEAKYYNDCVGVNSRLDELQAAFLNVKSPFLNTDNGQRIATAKRYLQEIKNDKIILPTVSLQETNQSNHVFHLFVIRTQNRNDLQSYLLVNGIETLIHYLVLPQQQKALSSEVLGWNHSSFPVAEKIHQEVLSLPMSPVLTTDEVDFIIDVLNRY